MLQFYINYYLALTVGPELHKISRCPEVLEQLKCPITNISYTNLLHY